MCEYCESNEPKSILIYRHTLLNVKSSISAEIGSDAESIVLYSASGCNIKLLDVTHINYCPMCGRKLRED